LVIRSYKSAFILVFTALMVVTVVSVGSNAYRRASQISLNLSADIIGEMSEKIIHRTVRIFEAAYSYLETNAILFEGREPALSREQVFRLFWRQLQLEPQLLSMYASDPAGNFLQVREQPQLVTRFIERSGDKPVEGLIYRNRHYEPIAHINGGGLYDPRDTSWYIGAMAAQGNVYWSSVYRFSGTGKLGFTAAKAVYREDETLHAVVAVDIALESLSEFLADQRGTRNAVALIVDRHDNLVAFPYQLILRERAEGEDPEALYKVDELADTRLVDAYRALGRVSSDSGTRPDPEPETGSHSPMQGHAVTRSDGTRYIAREHRFPASWSDGWKLFVVVPEASLLSAASRLLSESIIISVIILIGAVLLVSLLALRLFEPMRKLVSNTELVQQFRLDDVEPVNSRFREIQAMDQAICSMRQGLQTLAKFVPGAVARDLMQSSEEAKPGGEVVEITLFFSAMSEFATLCRTLPPERISTILAILLDQFTRIVLRSRGNIDNYLGESIMAFWGAPLAVPDGPQRACRVALQCMRAEEALRREDPQAFPVATRNLFAIHAGRAIVGNIGSATRMSYTAVGDNVELGWKLKQLNHRYGTRIILSEPVRAAVGDRFWLRRLDVIPSHGGREALPIYELLGERSIPLTTQMQTFVGRYEQGLAAVLNADWETAQSLFDALSDEYPQDESVRLMALRCAARDACLCPRLTGSGVDVLDALADAV
jgi:adenylate cyclase